jgi:serine protease Do
MKQDHLHPYFIPRFSRGKLRLLAGALCAGAMALGSHGLAQNSPAASVEKPEKTESPAPPVKVDSAQLSRGNPSAITSFAPIVEKVAPSVVTVYTTKNVRQDLRAAPGMDNELLRRFFGGGGQGGQGNFGQPEKTQGLGSGVIVSPDGQILTNNHVIEGADEILVRLGSGDREYKATKIGSDPGTDLAVLKINAKDLPAVTFADSDKARIGDMVLAIGNPFGLGQTVTSGIISAVSRAGMGIVDYENFIQTDASINPGNSGGALVDAEGRVVGINTAIYSRSGGNMGIGFAVPSNLARQVFQSLHEKGRVVRGYLGMGIQTLTSGLARVLKLPEGTVGALVREVEPGSPSEKAGVVSGDVVIGLNGNKIESDRQLRLSVSGMAPGTNVTLKLLRDGKEKELPAKLGELPDRNRIAGNDGGMAPQGGKSNILDGITVGNIDEATRRDQRLSPRLQGALITAVEPDSAGYEAGLRPGDIVTEINRQPVKDADEAIALGDKIEKDDSVLLRVYSRNGGSRYVALSPKTP